MAYEIVEGDLDPDMQITVLVNGLPLDLTTASLLQMRWQKPDATVVTVSLTAVSLANGQVKRVWAAGDTAQTGEHLARVLVTWASGEVQSFPSDGSYMRWEVNPQLQET